MSASEAEIRKFAVRVVEVYSLRVSMTLLAQGELEREIAALLRETLAAGEPVVDWAPLANRTLDGWDRRHGTRGPRVAPIPAITSRVSERRRAA